MAQSPQGLPMLILATSTFEQFTPHYDIWVTAQIYAQDRFEPLFHPMAHWGSLGAMSPSLWQRDFSGEQALFLGAEIPAPIEPVPWWDWPHMMIPGYLATIYYFESWGGHVDCYVQSQKLYGSAIFELFELNIPVPHLWHRATRCTYRGVRWQVDWLDPRMRPMLPRL